MTSDRPCLGHASAEQRSGAAISRFFPCFSPAQEALIPDKRNSQNGQNRRVAKTVGVKDRS